MDKTVLNLQDKHIKGKKGSEKCKNNDNTVCREYPTFLLLSMTGDV